MQKAAIMKPGHHDNACDVGHRRREREAAPQTQSLPFSLSCIGTSASRKKKRRKETPNSWLIADF
jgi:hypothetical protein